MGQPDLTLRALLGKKDVAADIINNLIYDGETVIQETDLELRPEAAQVVGERLELKGMTRDVCMEDKRDGTLYQIFGLESQMDDDYTMPVRVMGYDYASYQRQIEEWQNANRRLGKNAAVHKLFLGQKLKPVITIVLYYGKMNSEMPKDLHSMLEFETGRVKKEFVPNYCINLVELGKLSPEQMNRFTSDFNYVAKFVFTTYNKSDGFRSLLDNKRVLTHPRETVMTLAAISKDQRYWELLQKKGEEIDMCEFLDMLEMRGQKKGRKEGEDRFAELTLRLIEDKRLDELKRAAQEIELRAKLYEEYGLAELETVL